MADLDEQFGEGEVLMRRLSDAAGVLKVKQRHQVEKWFDQFERSFPQLFFSVYFGSLEEMANLRQFGLWLLNRAAFEDVGLDRPNDGAIMLVVDVEAKTACVSYGYLLDLFLTEEDTFQVLSIGHPYFLQGDYYKGLSAIVRKLTAILRKRVRHARRNPDQYERLAGRGSEGVEGILRRIRSGSEAASPGREAQHSQSTPRSQNQERSYH
ncbi:MAG: TPM domain-containing protein [Akkermansiaceae bacterium]